MLERGYLEILTPVAGADAAAERLAGAGFRLQATVHLHRTIEGADGSAVQVAFTVVRPRFGSIPGGRLQVLTHLSPEHLWQARYIARDNAITGLSEAVLAVRDPAASVGRLTRFTGRGVRETDGGFLLGRGVGLLVDAPERLIVDPQDAMGATLVIEPEKDG